MSLLNDIATDNVAKSRVKKAIVAAITLTATFVWSLISVTLSIGGNAAFYYSLLITAMLNGIEMIGLDVALTPVRNAIRMDSDAREKIRIAVQILWAVMVGSAYVAEALVVGTGTWKMLSGIEEGIVQFFLTFAITVVTVFGTDFSLNTLIAALRKTEQVSEVMASGLTDESEQPAPLGFVRRNGQLFRQRK